MEPARIRATERWRRRCRCRSTNSNRPVVVAAAAPIAAMILVLVLPILVTVKVHGKLNQPLEHELIDSLNKSNKRNATNVGDISTSTTNTPSRKRRLTTSTNNINSYYGIGKGQDVDNIDRNGNGDYASTGLRKINNNNNSSSSSSSSYNKDGISPQSIGTIQSQPQQHSSLTSKILDDVFGPPDELDTETTYHNTIGTEEETGVDGDGDEQAEDRQRQGCLIFVDECCIDDDCPGNEVCSTDRICVQASPMATTPPPPPPPPPSPPTPPTTASPTTQATTSPPNNLSSPSIGDEDNEDNDGCLVPLDECCEAKDCFIDGEVCVHRNCIDDGFLRFTLFWEGDDDYDLYVETPGGAQLSYDNIFDPVSLGRYGEEADQFGQGYHVENIHFPENGGPPGRYKFYVRPLTTVNDGDEWTVQVVEDGNVVISESGLGLSNEFEYFRQSQSTGPPSPSRPPLGGSPSAPLPSPPTTLFPTPAPVRRPTDPPVGVPTRPPQSLDDCTEFTDQCCIDSDCSNPNEVCEQRTCLRDGSPRFTLQWTGDDDLDFFVRTPDGVTITVGNTYDEVSGGRYQRDDDQSGFGFHVESVYFPVIGAPLGMYEYGVRSVTERGASDAWYIEIREAGSIVDTRGGAGESAIYSYVRRDATIEGPQRPRPEPPICSTPLYDCCADSDCLGPSELCLHRTCVNEGSLRVSLTWIGDDDLDLYVETPDGAIISRFSELDPASQGRYGDGGVQTEFDFHVESIYFPLDGAPIGSYRFYIEAYTVRGFGADVWTVSVYEYGKPARIETGIGDSPTFRYVRTLSPSGPTAPNQPPQIQPSTPSSPSSSPQTSCSTDADCRQDQMCIEQTCIFRGNPQVVLNWTGDDDLDLFVVSPENPDVPIYAFNSYDAISGGRFDGSGIQDEPGSHIENVYFAPESGRSGTYTYYIHSFRSTNEDDEWTVTIYADGTVVRQDKGKGSSKVVPFDVDIRTDSLPPRPDGAEERNCDPAGHQCCSSAACAPNEHCSFRQCVKEGSPRFTLNWQGNDDLDLVVLTPLGTVVSFANSNDVISGGMFGSQKADQYEFGDHVENIYFPFEGGPIGTYKYQVKSFLPNGTDDEWTVRAYVNGRVESSIRGSGSSGELTFVFLGLPPTISPISDTAQPIAPTLIPTPNSSGAGPTEAQDCSSSGCQSPTEVCVTSFCIAKGLPRFTLQYDGDDRFSLSVVTPFGTTISQASTSDPLSGGEYVEEGNQSGSGKRAVNIYFPFDTGGPMGTYTFRVNAPSSGQMGDPTTWLLTVHEGDVEGFSRSGTGEANYLYEYRPDGPPTTVAPAIGPSPPPAIQCSVRNDQCCENTDCLENQQCVQRQCIDDGSPRFTLQWIGATDYDLRVTPPIGSTISLNNQIDEASGGIFGENGVQVFFGLHVENIFFPQNGPVGIYSVDIKEFQDIQDGGLEQWTLQIYAGGELRQTETGSGSSGTILFDYQEGLLGRSSSSVVAELETPCVADPTNYGCCSVNDCLLPQHDLCIVGTCIGGRDKNRITLTWFGDDDLDLVLQLPNGRNVSNAQLPIDNIDGVFETSRSSVSVDLFGAHRPHVESIYFPSGAPPGKYGIFVESFWQIGEADPWTLQIYVEGTPAATESFFGTSGASLQFQYGQEIPERPVKPTGSSSFFIASNNTGGVTVSTCDEENDQGC